MIKPVQNGSYNMYRCRHTTGERERERVNAIECFATAAASAHNHTSPNGFISDLGAILATHNRHEIQAMIYA